MWGPAPFLSFYKVVNCVGISRHKLDDKKREMEKIKTWCLLETKRSRRTFLRALIRLFFTVFTPVLAPELIGYEAGNETWPLIHHNSLQWNLNSNIKFNSQGKIYPAINDVDNCFCMALRKTVADHLHIRIFQLIVTAFNLIKIRKIPRNIKQLSVLTIYFVDLYFIMLIFVTSFSFFLSFNLA